MRLLLVEYWPLLPLLVLSKSQSLEKQAKTHPSQGGFFYEFITIRNQNVDKTVKLSSRTCFGISLDAEASSA